MVPSYEDHTSKVHIFPSLINNLLDNNQHNHDKIYNSNQDYDQAVVSFEYYLLVSNQPRIDL